MDSKRYYQCKPCDLSTDSWVDFERHRDKPLHRFNTQKAQILERLEEIEKTIQKLAFE